MNPLELETTESLFEELARRFDNFVAAGNKSLTKSQSGRVMHISCVDWVAGLGLTQLLADRIVTQIKSAEGSYGG